MTKCDFCVNSLPNGQCRWTFFSLRESDCKKAIEKMVETLKNIGVNKT